MNTDVTRQKQAAAWRAVELVEPGMVVGLGAGSTAVWAVRRIAERLQASELYDVVGIPASLEIEAEARNLGIPLVDLSERPVIDLTIDGADEVDGNLNLIKGGGGALLREKIVAQASRREIIVVDETKLSEVLGTAWAVPVEVIPFGWRSQFDYLEALGAKVTLRRQEDGTLFMTDQQNLIMDCDFGPINDCHALARAIKRRAGIVEHGLFLGLATDVIAAGADGIRHLVR